MSSNRIVIFDSTGNALYGACFNHGQPTQSASNAAWVACWIEDATALLAKRGITDVIAVAFEPEEGGDYAMTRAIECHTLRLDMHTTPAGNIEVLGMYHTDAVPPEKSARAIGAQQRVRSSVPEGSGHRVLHSTVPGLAATAQLQSREPVSAAAARHRANNPRAWKE